MSVFIPVDANVTIEADIHRNTSTKDQICLIFTHPYSLMGGDMHNNVPASLFKYFKGKYNTVIRFNFRGVGQSTGWSTITGWSERDDVLAVCKYALNLSDNPPKRIFIVGYSFGSAVACGIANEMKEIEGYVAIGYPRGWLASWLFSSHYPKAACNKPKLLIMGTSDQWTSLSTFDGWVETLPEPKEKSIIEGADHFFFGQEHKIIKKVETWLQKF